MQRAPRSPTRFVVARHLISHPDDSPGQIAFHCHLQIPSASRALRAILAETGLEPAALLEFMLRTPEKPRWRSFHYRAPNPSHWVKAAMIPYQLSGDVAAATVDGLNLSSDRTTIYVRENDVEAAMKAASRIYAKPASPSKSNLVLRVADPWMAFEGNVAEKGQRWHDYATSTNLQLRRWRP